MVDQLINDSLLDLFVYETTELVKQLEQITLDSETEGGYTPDKINEIFRIMHTIKGSSAMMSFHKISELAHSLEDIFFLIREKKPKHVNCSTLSDLILEGIDLIKLEIDQIKSNIPNTTDTDGLIDRLMGFMIKLQQSEETDDKTNSCHTYKAVLYFEDGCGMENIRAFGVVNNLKEIAQELYYQPENILDNNSSEIILRDGFMVHIKTNHKYEELYQILQQTIFLKELELSLLEEIEHKQPLDCLCKDQKSKSATLEMDGVDQINQNPSLAILQDEAVNDIQSKSSANPLQGIAMQQRYINVSVSKLDKLLDLVGEMVISEAMVIHNPDLQGLELNNFDKAARQLNKISSEIKDMVMSIRMVPLTAIFQKMHRIVRDMSKKLNKEVVLEIIGEETEVDKNIIEHISDPLMHLVRNAIDHGIESKEERINAGKTTTGKITIEAKNEGSDVLIIIKDDGHGLDKDKIIQKAKENQLLYMDETHMSDKEIYNLILLPGFSTKEMVTEYSGRGVGMDVVQRNIETISGSLSVDSELGQGTKFTIKIPLTLAIIDGMNIRVGKSVYTIPTASILEAIQPKGDTIIKDPDGNEMVMVRGACYPILRLHEFFHIETRVTKFTEGILIIVKQENRISCIFADELLGQQQIVVKALPKYIQKIHKIKGLTGCTLLGDGSISLILDIVALEKINEIK